MNTLLSTDNTIVQVDINTRYVTNDCFSDYGLNTACYQKRYYNMVHTTRKSISALVLQIANNC